MISIDKIVNNNILVTDKVSLIKFYQQFNFFL